MTLTYIDNEQRGPVVPSVVTDDLDSVIKWAEYSGKLKIEEVDTCYFDIGTGLLWSGEKRPKMVTSKCVIQFPCTQMGIFKRLLTITHVERPDHRVATSDAAKSHRLVWFLTKEYAQEIVDGINKMLPDYTSTIEEYLTVCKAATLALGKKIVVPTEFPNAN